MMPFTWGRTSAIRKAERAPGSSVVRVTGWVWISINRHFRHRRLALPVLTAGQQSARHNDAHYRPQAGQHSVSHALPRLEDEDVLRLVPGGRVPAGRSPRSGRPWPAAIPAAAGAARGGHWSRPPGGGSGTGRKCTGPGRRLRFPGARAAGRRCRPWPASADSHMRSRNSGCRKGRGEPISAMNILMEASTRGSPAEANRSCTTPRMTDRRARTASRRIPPDGLQVRVGRIQRGARIVRPSCIQNN